MCALCGILGGRRHWTESTGAPEAFASRPEAHTRHRERQTRTRLVNAVLDHYGLRLADWSGGQYVLRGRTGRTALVDNLSELWAEADRLGSRDCDPLDPDLLADLKARGHG
ncbi:MAG: hypothetical protein QF578_18310 [Alphaproteobacteria bacterium]|jgi:hypothetical protein|nr:hypothetical protein [Alphaproteobacteria bacterium]MDP6566788.1 hypothetical protein [Alphaproteobacteria bacterium]MDP6812288.1 hypothetical protein [Alphaproteobacteria bacterium]